MRMRIRSVAAVAVTAGLTLVLSPLPAPRAQDSPLLSAMQDEMTRSMADLRMNGEPSPYYIEYEIDDLASMRAVARLGGIVDDLADHSRTLHVGVRVGEYGFDSSRFITQDRGAGVVPSLTDLTVPLDDNYAAIRRQIWLATDAAYKRAVSVFAKKKATFQNRAATDALADFSKEKPTETLRPVQAPKPTGSQWVDRVRQLSAVFSSTPGLDGSEVLLSETHGNMYYLNSEGFKSITPVGSVYLRLSADAQADDGATVRDLFTVVEGRLEELPPMTELMSHARTVAARARLRRTASIGEEFTGPLLVEGQASAELLRQTLAPLLLARRPPDAENARFTQGQGQGTPFLTRIGLRVLSDSFAVSDTPSLKEFEGRPVAGTYVVDDEGVLAKDVTLVEKGRLVTLLTSRTPQKNLLQSNGHGRGGNVQPGVLQVRSTEAIPASQLKEKYLQLLQAQEKPFGYIIRSIAGPGEVPGGGGGGGPIILDIVKVTPDGKEEQVRGLRFGDVPSTAFRDILEASEERTLLSYRINVATSASVIAPSLIFEELEVQRTREIVQKPPIVPSPLIP
jgi:predicted Zn-dependent protease